MSVEYDVISKVGMLMKLWLRWVFGQEDTAVRGTVNGWLVGLLEALNLTDQGQGVVGIQIPKKIYLAC